MLVAALGDYAGTMLFVSHDRRFLAALSNRVLELTADGAQSCGGCYVEYVARTAGRRRAAHGRAAVSGAWCSRPPAGSSASGAAHGELGMDAVMQAIAERLRALCSAVGVVVEGESHR